MTKAGVGDRDSHLDREDLSPKPTEAGGLAGSSCLSPSFREPGVRMWLLSLTFVPPPGNLGQLFNQTPSPPSPFPHTPLLLV